MIGDQERQIEELREALERAHTADRIEVRPFVVHFTPIKVG